MSTRDKSLNPYYTGSTLWGMKKVKLIFFEPGVLILIILEVLYEYGIFGNFGRSRYSLNPYYTGSTLWDKLNFKFNERMKCLNPYYTGSTLWGQ